MEVWDDSTDKLVTQFRTSPTSTSRQRFDQLGTYYAHGTEAVHIIFYNMIKAYFKNEKNFNMLTKTVFPGLNTSVSLMLYTNKSNDEFT